MKRNPKSYAAGVLLFLFLTVIDIAGKAGGTPAVAGVIVAAAALLFIAARARKNGRKKSFADLPPENQIRASQAVTEERLREQAKAPDEKEESPYSAQIPGSGTSAYGTSANEFRERSEQLKSLCEGGIISAEEYRERIGALRKDAKKI